MVVIIIVERESKGNHTIATQQEMACDTESQHLCTVSDDDVEVTFAVLGLDKGGRRGLLGANLQRSPRQRRQGVGSFFGGDSWGEGLEDGVL